MRVERGRGRGGARPPPDHERAPGRGVQQQGHVGEELLLHDVLDAAAGVGLAVDGEEAPRAAHRRRDRDDRLSALPVEEERPLLAQPRREAEGRVEAVGPLEPVAVDARGHEDGVPRRPERDERARGRGRPQEGGGLGEGPGLRCERPRAPGQEQPGEHQVRRLEAEVPHQHEVGGERARDRPRGVPGVEPAGRLLRAGAGAREVEEQREGEAEGDRDRQHGGEAQDEAGGLVRGERDGQRAERGEVRDRELADRPLAGEHGRSPPPRRARPPPARGG